MRLQLSSIKQDIKEIAEMYQCHFSEYFFFVLEIYFFLKVYNLCQHGICLLLF